MVLKSKLSDSQVSIMCQVLRKDFKLRTCRNLYLVSVIYDIGHLLGDASIIFQLHMKQHFLKALSSV